MTVRSIIEDRMSALPATADEELQVRLATSLKRDGSVRTSMLKRLSSSMRFSYGARAGALKTAAKRSGSAFRMDVRQRVIVKALVSRHMGKGMARAGALAAHVRYLGREGAGHEGEAGTFFDRNEEAMDGTERIKDWAGHRHHFRHINSPEHGDRIADLRGYVREVMARVSADLGEPDLRWVATCHYDTDQPHAHVLVRGRRADGRDLVIPRDYMGYGFRARAQEVAQERLGDLSRVEAERRVWKETQADRFTGLDRRLLAAADAGGMVDDGTGGTGAWAALSRGRLRHLEGLGLAVRTGRRYRLEPEMEIELRTLQVRRDIIRTMNQRRLEGAREVRLLGRDKVAGVVVKTGFHDEVGAAPWVVVRDAQGVEHYGRLKVGGQALAVGDAVALAPVGQGMAVVMKGRSLER